MRVGWGGGRGGGGEELVGDGLDKVLTMSSRSYLHDVTRLGLHYIWKIKNIPLIWQFARNNKMIQSRNGNTVRFVEMWSSWDDSRWIGEWTNCLIGRIEKFFNCGNVSLSEKLRYLLFFDCLFTFGGFPEHSLIQIMGLTDTVCSGCSTMRPIRRFVLSGRSPGILPLIIMGIKFDKI